MKVPPGERRVTLCFGEALGERVARVSLLTQVTASLILRDCIVSELPALEKSPPPAERMSEKRVREFARHKALLPVAVFRRLHALRKSAHVKLTSLVRLCVERGLPFWESLPVPPSRRITPTDYLVKHVGPLQAVTLRTGRRADSRCAVVCLQAAVIEQPRFVVSLWRGEGSSVPWPSFALLEVALQDRKAEFQVLLATPERALAEDRLRETVASETCRLFGLPNEEAPSISVPSRPSCETATDETARPGRPQEVC